MIRINLLPYQKTYRRHHGVGVYFQATVGVGIFLIISGLCWLWASELHQELEALLVERDTKEQILASLKRKSHQVEGLAKTHEALLFRSRLFEQRTGKKFVPVVLMDAVSRSLNPLNLWLLHILVNGQEVEIEGRGWSRQDIQKFANDLEQTLPWENLLSLETQVESYQSSRVYRFNLRFTMDG